MNPVLIYRSKCPESEGKVLLNIYSHLKVNSKTFFFPSLCCFVLQRVTLQKRRCSVCAVVQSESCKLYDSRCSLKIARPRFTNTVCLFTEPLRFTRLLHHKPGNDAFRLTLKLFHEFHCFVCLSERRKKICKTHKPILEGSRKHFSGNVRLIKPTAF